MKRISGLAKVRKVHIYNCPKLKLLEAVQALDSMELDWEHWEVAGPDAQGQGVSTSPRRSAAGAPRRPCYNQVGMQL